MEERRKFPRVKASLSLKISGKEYDTLTETKNISVTGIYCAIDRPLEPMTKLNIVLLIPFKKNNRKVVKKITCEGVVVRKDFLKNNGKYSYQIAIYFNSISEKNKKVITTYVNLLPQLDSVIKS